MATFDDVVRLCADLPEVTVSTSYETSARKVRGNGFCRLWGARDNSKANIGDVEVLAVFGEPDEKEFLLAESDGSVYTAPHNDGHCAALVLLDDVDEGLLEALLLERGVSLRRRRYSRLVDTLKPAARRGTSRCRHLADHPSPAPLIREAEQSSRNI